MRLVTLKEASDILGISVMTLRRKIYARSIPYTRSNSDKTGKFLLDIPLVEQVLRNESIANLRNSGGFVDPEPVIDFDPSFGAEENAPLSMATVGKRFPRITQDDATEGRFAPDTFAITNTTVPTSETLTIQQAPKKP